MLINYKHKFIFVGLPFSACSAISKELIERYGCEQILHKHASIPALKKLRPEIRVEEYEIVVVVRDPVEMCQTTYSWLKENRYDHFTDPEKRIENGGTVTRRHRELFKKIRDNKLTFEDYINYSYSVIPYDSLLSENSKYVTKVIRFENLQDEFKTVFKSLGLKIDRDIPAYNLTKNKNSFTAGEDLLGKVFSPFLMYNKKCYQESECFKKINSISAPISQRLIFRALRIIRRYHRLLLDKKLLGRKVSHID